ARQPPLRRQSPHQSAEPLTLTNVLDHAVEDLGCVSSRLSLEGRDERNLLDVSVFHPPSYSSECVFEWDPQLLVADYALELGARGLVGVVDDEGEPTDEAVAGAKAGCDHVEVVR